MPMCIKYVIHVSYLLKIIALTRFFSNILIRVISTSRFLYPDKADLLVDYVAP